jgi:hypothetical protein
MRPPSEIFQTVHNSKLSRHVYRGEVSNDASVNNFLYGYM